MVAASLARSTAAILCVTCFLQTALQNILVRYSSKNLTYSHSFTAWSIEVVKLVLATLMWSKEGAGKIQWRIGWVTPAVCYAINNRLFFLTLKHIDSGTFQIMSNLKIVTTVLWSIFLLRKRFSMVKWIACLYLGVGGMMIQGGELKEMDKLFPFILIMIQVVLSGFAGVIMEKMLVTPKEGETFAQQCMQLYMMGLPIMTVYIALDPPSLSSAYVTPLWLSMVINGSLQGLVIGSIMKSLGTVHKLFATLTSVALTMVYSHIVDETPMSMIFKYGCVVMIMAVILYQTETEQRGGIYQQHQKQQQEEQQQLIPQPSEA